MSLEPMNLRELVKRSFQQSKDAGFHDKDEDDHVAIKLALVHSEVSEALEAYRDPNEPAFFWRGEGDKPEGIAAELADVVIRVADLCGMLDIDLDYAVKAKLDYNRTRPYRHGGRKI